MSNFLEGPPVRRVDVSGTRFYYKQEQEEVPWSERIMAPSVTSVIDIVDKGYGFSKWLGDSASYEAAMAYAGEAALVGTIVHHLADKLVQGDTIKLPEFKSDNTGDSLFYDKDADETISVWPYLRRIQNRLVAFKKFWVEKQPEPLATEVSLFSKKFAGTVDLVAMMKFNRKKRVVMIDYKTGKDVGAEDKALQLTAYKDLWDKEFPKKPIEMIFNLFLGPNGGYTLPRRKYAPKEWKYVLGLWHCRHPEPPKEPKSLPTTFSLDEKVSGK